MAGYVYCLTNDAIPGLVKIGKTARDPVARAAEISASTGVPTPFDIVWSRKVPDMDAAEVDLHTALTTYRVSKRREFFRCTPAIAMKHAKKLPSFATRKPAAKRKPRNIDFMLGLTLASVTLGTFGSAVAFDLEPATVATVVTGAGLALTAFFQSVPLFALIRR